MKKIILACGLFICVAGAAQNSTFTIDDLKDKDWRKMEWLSGSITMLTVPSTTSRLKN